MARSPDVKTPLCRFSFVNLLKPRTFEEGKAPTYNCTLLFPKGTDISALQNAAVQAAVDEWGDKAKQMIKDGLIKNPFLDGDGPQGLSKKTGERQKGFAGMTFVRVMSGQDYPPVLVNGQRRPITKAEEFYAGCWGYAVVNAFTWENSKNGRGVSFSISMAQKVRDDEKLGGGAGDPDKYFDVIENEGEAPAETKQGQGAAGLFA